MPAIGHRQPLSHTFRHELRVYGPCKLLEEFKKKVHGHAYGHETPFSFESLVPTPRDADNRQDWRAKHWGVKFDAEDAVLNENEEGLFYGFTTASYPPLAWFKTISSEYPDLTFVLQYEDEMDPFNGTMIEFKDGEMRE